MVDIYTIQEKFTLPSKGKIYKDVPEALTLRSMTTEEEMRRLSQKDTYYKKMCDIIDTCIIEPMSMSSYDMCLGDYQKLVYGLRTVTYGSKVLNPTICPKCKKLNESEVDLYELKEIPFEGFKDEDFEVELPKSKVKVKIKLQTPRMLDDIDKETEEYNNKDTNLNPSFLITLKHSISYIDGEHYDPIKKEAFLKKLPMADTNALIQSILKLNNKIGLDTVVTAHCDKCNYDYPSSFRITSEFFGPTNY